MSGGLTQPAAPPTGSVRSECVEHLPTGATRPELEESFADRGFAGYAVPLSITVKHGKGETVLPEGFNVQRGSDAALALDRAGFAIPQVDGGAELKIETQESDDAAVTTLSIPILLLPKKPGDSDLVLPPLPISLARASGELLTVCTKPHTIAALDPTGNETEPEVRPNPDPVPQREEWEAAKQVAWGLLAGVIVGIIVAYLIRQWLRRPRPVRATPARHPWVVALDELATIRSSSLLAENRTDEHFDQVSDSVRKYLGARYGFDGLESTTDEMRRILKRVHPPVPGLDEITSFLEECDLVKFARKLPTQDECLQNLERGQQIVQSTTPPVYAPTLGTVAQNANRRHDDRERPSPPDREPPRPEASP